LRLRETTVRPMGRNARGVTGIRMRENDNVCAVRKIIKNEELLLVTEKGYGKRVAARNFTVHGRGTKGQIYFKLSDKTGRAVGVLSVAKGDAFVVITSRGMIIKMKVRSVSVMKRNAGGVRVVDLKETDTVAAIARILQD